ncbi:MAG: EI24 domain-containing protein, partial [Pseudoruegeria sp.]
MLQDFRLAVNQLGDPRFRRVLLLGIGLTIALLFAVSVVFITGIGWLIPDSLSLPFIGEVTWVDSAVSWAAIPLMMVLSVFLMVPVASAFTGLFLDEVSQAVEDKHYPRLPEGTTQPWSEVIRDTLSFLGVLVAANLAALVLYLFLAPFAPIIFWLLNGFLLGREYFQLV